MARDAGRAEHVQGWHKQRPDRHHRLILQCKRGRPGQAAMDRAAAAGGAQIVISQNMQSSAAGVMQQAGQQEEGQL